MSVINSTYLTNKNNLHVIKNIVNININKKYWAQCKYGLNKSALISLILLNNFVVSRFI